jgi:hypothetical protein
MLLGRRLNLEKKTAMAMTVLVRILCMVCYALVVAN